MVDILVIAGTILVVAGLLGYMFLLLKRPEV